MHMITTRVKLQGHRQVSLKARLAGLANFVVVRVNDSSSHFPHVTSKRTFLRLPLLSRFESSHVNHHHRNFLLPCSCQTAVQSLIPIKVAASAQYVPIMTALTAPSSLAV
ncbi:hypothetical protein QR685DRAFT_253641 [Neurospora intermedia]|uniref:Uncharacterized protein n=1 Tax=Neurospora intermedia TaxID=5142 RepID=A0ABR3DF75_NEUIN